MSSQRTRAPAAPKAKSDFPLKVTKKAKLLAILPVAIAIYMLFLGFSIFRSFHPKDSSRYTFGLPPIAISVLVLGALIATPRKMCNGVVSVRDTGIEYNPGDHDLNVHFPWNDLIFSAPRNAQQMVRSLILVHRDRKLVFYDLFMPDFDLLVAAITRRKTKSVSTQVDSGIKIDSGRIGQIDPRMKGR